MNKLDALGQTVSEFVKGAWSAAPSMQSLQAVFTRENFQALFNRAMQACSSIVASSPKIPERLQDTRVVVVASVTVVVVFVVTKVRGRSTPSDTVIVVKKGGGFKDVVAAYEPELKKDAGTFSTRDFVAKHGEKALDFLDESTKELMRSKEASNETLAPTQTETPSDRANALALDLKNASGGITMLRVYFDKETLFNVTDPEGLKYISKILEDAVRDKTITYPEIRPFFDLKVLAAMDPNDPRLKSLRNLFLSFEGRRTNFYKEDRDVFKCETNIYVLMCESIQGRPSSKSSFIEVQ